MVPVARAPANLNQRLAGTPLNAKLRAARLLLARYPFVTAWALVAVIVAGFVVLDRPWQSTRQATSSRLPAPSARYSVAAPVSYPPKDRVRGAGHALGILERACSDPNRPVSSTVLDRPLTELRAFARRYPNGHFRLGGESGTTVALLLVTRFLLQHCNPPQARTIGRLLAELTR